MITSTTHHHHLTVTALVLSRHKMWWWLPTGLKMLMLNVNSIQRSAIIACYYFGLILWFYDSLAWAKYTLSARNLIWTPHVFHLSMGSRRHVTSRPHISALVNKYLPALNKYFSIVFVWIFYEPNYFPVSPISCWSVSHYCHPLLFPSPDLWSMKNESQVSQWINNHNSFWYQHKKILGHNLPG